MRRITASDASHNRAAVLATASSTGWMSVGELLMTRRMSAVAVCCSSASARRFSSSRVPAASCFGALRASGRFVSALTFADIARRPINLPCLAQHSDRQVRRRSLSEQVRGRTVLSRVSGQSIKPYTSLCGCERRRRGSMVTAKAPRRANTYHVSKQQRRGQTCVVRITWTRPEDEGDTCARDRRAGSVDGLERGVGSGTGLPVESRAARGAVCRRADRTTSWRARCRSR